MQAIEVQSVSKSFYIPSERTGTVRETALGLLGRNRRSRKLQVLDRVSFSLGQGEVLGVMGRNGCGKSTLLRLIAGIYRPCEGTILRRGGVTPILDLGVGWNRDLNAVDNIYILGSVLGMTLREIRGAVDEILEFAELGDFTQLPLKHYSSGMGARLAYSVAFFTVREILLLDEIFATGDAGFRERCERRFRELRVAGHSVMMVSHSPNLVAEFCDRALLLEQGQVLQEGTGAEIADAYVEMLCEDPDEGPVDEEFSSHLRGVG